MSRLLTLQNRLKVRARRDRLADHQRRLFDQVVERWHYSEKANLHGPAGVGKTFLGWALAREQDALFFAAPELFVPDAVPPGRPVIVDNVDADERPLRRLLATLQLANVHAALLISRRPNPGLLPALELSPPDETDLITVLHNLSELEHYALTMPESANLWQIIHATL